MQVSLGTADISVGALTFNQGSISSGITQLGSGSLGLLDLGGKAWTSPNTAIGLALGIAGLPFGAEPSLGHNAIQFANNPVMFGGDITIGNTINYNSEIGPNVLAPDQPGYTYGSHEEMHTFQAEITGPFFLPLNLFGGLYSEVVSPVGDSDPWHYNNFMENGPLSVPPSLWSSNPGYR